MRQLRSVLGGIALVTVFAAAGTAWSSERKGSEASAKGAQTAPAARDAAINVRFLEVVTPQAAATIELLETHHGLDFSEPIPELGNARVARLDGGGRMSVRAPLAAHETPVVRPYLLVADIAAAWKAAIEAGAEAAHPPLEIPGQGTFAIYILGGIQHGLWQDLS